MSFKNPLKLITRRLSKTKNPEEDSPESSPPVQLNAFTKSIGTKYFKSPNLLRKDKNRCGDYVKPQGGFVPPEPRSNWDEPSRASNIWNEPKKDSTTWDEPPKITNSWNIAQECSSSFTEDQKIFNDSAPLALPDYDLTEASDVSGIEFDPKFHATATPLSRTESDVSTIASDHRYPLIKTLPETRIDFESIRCSEYEDDNIMLESICDEDYIADPWDDYEVHPGEAYAMDYPDCKHSNSSTLSVEEFEPDLPFDSQNEEDLTSGFDIKRSYDTMDYDDNIKEAGPSTTDYYDTTLERRVEIITNEIYYEDVNLTNNELMIELSDSLQLTEPTIKISPPPDGLHADQSYYAQQPMNYGDNQEVDYAHYYNDDPGIEDNSYQRNREDLNFEFSLNSHPTPPSKENEQFPEEEQEQDYGYSEACDNEEFYDDEAPQFDVRHEPEADPFHEAQLLAEQQVSLPQLGDDSNLFGSDKLWQPFSIQKSKGELVDVRDDLAGPMRPPPPRPGQPRPGKPPSNLKLGDEKPVVIKSPKKHVILGMDLGPLPSDPDPYFGFKSHFSKKSILPNAKKGLQNILSGESKKERQKRKEREELERIINSGSSIEKDKSEDLKEANKSKTSEESWLFFQDLTARVTATVEDTVSKISVLNINSTVEEINKPNNPRKLSESSETQSEDKNEKRESEPEEPKEQEGWASFDPKVQQQEEQQRPVKASQQTASVRSFIQPGVPIQRAPQSSKVKELKGQAPSITTFIGGLFNPFKQPRPPTNAVRLPSEGPPPFKQPGPPRPGFQNFLGQRPRLQASNLPLQQRFPRPDWNPSFHIPQVPSENSGWANFAETAAESTNGGDWANFEQKESLLTTQESDWANFNKINNTTAGDDWSNFNQIASNDLSSDWACFHDSGENIETIIGEDSWPSGTENGFDQKNQQAFVTNFS